ncbi:MBL fold metallo-hydrolase [Microbulbifer elongatus]|uniref:MBL fold metallo-hydrolase n=1 Tax=Microbulbifer elongatus TaxID=86173 RepID=UPI001E62C551|nr:MBL fold metallo-hydrolase [Microbulbifer elongatus]
MQLVRIETPVISHFAYLITDGDVAAIVDPRRDVDVYLRTARDLGCRITHILETHRHEDFVMGSRYLAEVTGAKVVNTGHALFGRGDIALGDREGFEVGALKLVALHTPGHTPESVCYLVFGLENDRPWGVFTGDTLFYGDTGRSDLPDEARAVENAGCIYDSVHEKLGGLDDEVLVFPAHGPGSVCGSGMHAIPHSTLGRERRVNPVFVKDRAAFAQQKGGEELPRPPYFRRMELVNLNGGLQPSASVDAVALMPPDRFAEAARDAKVIDTREPEGYCAAHIKNSYSVWLQGLPVFGGWVAESQDRILLVCDREEDIREGAMHLARIGLDRVVGGLKGGFPGWRDSGQPWGCCGVISPQSLRQALPSQRVLDVREAGEFAAGHIPGALHCFVGHLEEKLAKLALDKNAPLVVTCGVGHRAGVAVSILRRAGFRDVRNLLGGMKAWHTCDFPVMQGREGAPE